MPTGRRRYARPSLSPFGGLFRVLAGEGEIRVTLDQLGPLSRKPVPGRGHLQELVALLADDALGERTAFFRMLAVFGGFLHGGALLAFPAAG
jgi:hypothetical protein